MKTLLSLLYTFGVTAGAVSLDSHQLNPGALVTALAVAALFTIALNDGPRLGRPMAHAPVARFPGRRSGDLAGRAKTYDLAA